MQTPIELKTIRIMLAIEREGSFAKAADALYISQPALTQYIKRVEAALAYPLYDRQNGKCSPTAAGKILLKRGKVLLEQYEMMQKEMENAANCRNTDIHFGWPMGYTVHYLHKIVSDTASLGTFQVHAAEDSVESLIELLLQDKLDVLFIPALYEHPDLLYTTICREEFYLAVPRSHIANSIINRNGPTEYVNLADLKDMHYIFINAKAYTEFIHPFFQEAGYQPSVIFRCNNWDSGHALVEDGLGLSFVPYWFEEKGQEKVNYYRIRSNCRTYRTFTCVLRRGRPISPELKIFMEHVKAIFRNHNPRLPFDYPILSHKLK